MRFEELNKRFNKKVARWMSKGYYINAGTMSGSQGEIAHVDMTNGTDLIRVLMYEDREYENGKRIYECYEYTAIVVGRVPESERVKPNLDRGLGNTVWNNKLEALEEDRFYKIGDRSKWYGTKAEAAEAKRKWCERCDARIAEERSLDKDFGSSLEAKKAVWSFIRRQPGCKTVHLNEIAAVKKVSEWDWNGNLKGVKYVVKARGREYKLA